MNPLPFDNLGGGMKTPLTSSGHPVYSTLETDENGNFTKQTYYRDDDPTRPASASLTYAGGYSTDNSGTFDNFMQRVIGGGLALIGGGAAIGAGAAASTAVSTEGIDVLGGVEGVGGHVFTDAEIAGLGSAEGVGSEYTGLEGLGGVEGVGGMNPGATALSIGDSLKTIGNSLVAKMLSKRGNATTSDTGIDGQRNVSSAYSEPWQHPAGAAPVAQSFTPEVIAGGLVFIVLLILLLKGK